MSKFNSRLGWQVRLRRFLRAIGIVIGGLVSGSAAGYILTGCAPDPKDVTAVTECDTSDLQSAYWDQLIAACYAHEGPLDDCPGYHAAAQRFEAAVVERCGSEDPK